MKKIVMMCLIVFAAAFAAACNQTAKSNPVAPEISGITSVTAEVRSDESRKVCHHNPDYLLDGGYEWTVIEVDVYGQMNAHCGYLKNRTHGDYTSGGYRTCGACYIEGYSVGSNCSFCD